jgi:hypothetical protein
VCKLELHPVYRFRNDSTGGAAIFSGPREGGSPIQMRPDWIGATNSTGPGVTYTPNGPNGTNYRYCWNELGSPCSYYGGGGGAFN